MSNLKKRLEDVQANKLFSGSFLLQTKKHEQLEGACGFANRSEQLENKVNTRFGIASGCKLFTAIAICQLVQDGKLTFDAKLSEILSIDLKNWDSNVTVHHLLTHTSGIPDYFDEELMDDFEDLWVKYPMYHIRKLEDFLPLFQDQPMKGKVGERFHYNNGGYIVLGLIVEKVSGLAFSDYVETYIFEKAEMNDSGYFAMDQLPSNTAIGYIDQEDGTWKTNIYSLPVKGGSDGGAYVTTRDMGKLWKALLQNKLLSKSFTEKLLTSHVQVKDTSYYGYGVWIKQNENGVEKYHVMGYDPGVSFHSAYYPSSETVSVVCSNKSSGAFDIMKEMEKDILG
ncbi:beta-lactamase family protein [Radiobacillus kanasensis]|uniref:serine hydrolase domain-containing protein n=1 Tax=Radiobacillus kanasensis TaxID=2844358 RepID=UPI001E51F96C|nr:serine hydrolase [Radiobacillus kanasensis]UFT98347.1 beta-lactamase family protein [Radiobacillus kanasensis]